MGRRVGAAIVAMAVLLVAAPGFSDRASAQAAATTVGTGGLTVVVQHDPFAIRVEQGGEVVAETVPVSPLPSGTGPHGPVGFAVGVAAEAHELGYLVDLLVPLRWFHATRVLSVDGDVLTVETDDPLGRTLAVTVGVRGDGIVDLAITPSSDAGIVATGAAFRTDADQRFLGFGERSDGADQTGRRVVSWNEEGPFSAGLLRPLTDPIFGEDFQGGVVLPGTNYAMPTFLSTRGYGFLLDSDWLNGFDLGATAPDTWSVTTREPALRTRWYAGPSPADALERQTADLGRQPEPAEWFFGPWIQPGPEPQFWLDNDVPTTVAQTYSHYLPCAAHDGARDGQRAAVQRWHDAGARITTYVNSFVCNQHPQGAYDEGDANGWFVQHPLLGTYPAPYVAYLEPDGLTHGIVDFTDPEATAFWQRLVAQALEDGHDGWMEDFGEYVPADAVVSDGRTGLEYHNRYCTDYHRASHELTWPARGRDFAQFVRCGYTGTARYARVVWGGDPSEDFSEADGLAASVQQGLSMGLSGIGYWGSDIGGFHGTIHGERTDAELLTRWIQFGAFSGVMRLQRTGYGRPQLDATYPAPRVQAYDEEVLPVYRRYAKLRTQLFPVTWEAAQQYQRTGMPIMRHLALAYPDDPAVHAGPATTQFLYGEDLLVAPVLEDGARSREVYLPEGRWVAFWDAVAYDEATGDVRRTGQPVEVLEGRRTITVDAPPEEIPVFVREGACLPVLPADVDTLTTLGARDDVVDRTEAGALEELDFGGCTVAAPAPAPGDEVPPVPDSSEPDASAPATAPLPATGGGVGVLGALGLAAAAWVRSRTRTTEDRRR